MSKFTLYQYYSLSCIYIEDNVRVCMSIRYTPNSHCVSLNLKIQNSFQLCSRLVSVDIINSSKDTRTYVFHLSNIGLGYYFNCDILQLSLKYASYVQHQCLQCPTRLKRETKEFLSFVTLRRSISRNIIWIYLVSDEATSSAYIAIMLCYVAVVGFLKVLLT